MATAARNTKKTEAPKSRWASLVEEAQSEIKDIAPYVFDGCDPPIEIHPPTSVEQVAAVAEIVESSGYDMVRFKDLLQVIVGEEFPRLWEVVRRAPFNALMKLVDDMSSHFFPNDDQADDLPGGA